MSAPDPSPDLTAAAAAPGRASLPGASATPHTPFEDAQALFVGTSGVAFVLHHLTGISFGQLLCAGCPFLAVNHRPGRYQEQ